MDIYYPQEQANDSIGLCAKIAYGSISTKKLIEWYEIQKKIGVNKVVTFKYNLTGSALDVFEYYQEEGFVDLLPYQYPHKGEFICGSSRQNCKQRKPVYFYSSSSLNTAISSGVL